LLLEPREWVAHSVTSMFLKRLPSFASRGISQHRHCASEPSPFVLPLVLRKMPPEQTRTLVRPSAHSAVSRHAAPRFRTHDHVDCVRSLGRRSAVCAFGLHAKSDGSTAVASESRPLRKSLALFGSITVGSKRASSSCLPPRGAWGVDQRPLKPAAEILRWAWVAYAVGVSLNCQWPLPACSRGIGELRVAHRSASLPR